ncbi:substrate-binding domain-containing protein [Amycolatopsis deserti]|uniref:substrate-binding domain-containing protein n=1 Tax=Amycolatopsis deserti TaxID=185696 RepID=UPI001E2F241C|nr:substrate-binding domain-containing protein [Amycolatopsis deserti]
MGEASGYRPGETTRRILAADGRPQLGRRRAAPGESTGSHRVAPPGEATGSHRVIGETKRGIAKWPIVAASFVVLLVLGLLGWGWADSILNSRAEAQASACAEGDSNLNVIAAPSVAPAVTAAAERWNQARTVVHAHCVHVHVQAIDDQRVLLALTGRGNIDSIGGQPAVWIPENTATITELTAAKPTLLTSPSESLATTATADYPCAVLTADDVDEVQQRASQVFRNYLQEPAQKADFTRVLTPGA